MHECAGPNLEFCNATACWVVLIEAVVQDGIGVFLRNQTHPRPGILSHCPVMPAMRLLWMIMTPLGWPVEPLVYMTTARSEGVGL